jgi:excisionase family DNA binding protein
MRDATEAQAPARSNALMTAGDVARRWQVKTSAVYRLAREGRLPTVRVGRYVRFRPEAVEAFELEGGADA